MPAPKKVSTKVVKPAPRRPQLNKMGPGENYVANGRFYNGVALDYSPSGYDRRNASYAYNRNPANKVKEIAAITKASKGGKLRKGGK